MSQDKSILDAAVIFTAQFGFLTQNIFFDHICPRSQRRKYSNWNNLKMSKLFRESRSSDKVLLLTPKGAVASGIRAVRPRFASYIPHDSEVARLIFALREIATVQQVWTETQLKESPWDAISIMGTKNLEKLPDAIMDLEGASGNVRIAIEMECNRKSKERYEQIALSYINAKKIDLIVFVGNRASDLEVIRQAFASTDLTPALTRIADFKKDGVDAAVVIRDRRLTLSELLGKILKVPRKSKCHLGVTAVTPDESDLESSSERIA